MSSGKVSTNEIYLTTRLIPQVASGGKMRFHITYIDEDGYAERAEHLEYPNFAAAVRFAGRKVDRKADISAGFFVSHADSEFIRRYTQKPGGVKYNRAEPIELEYVLEKFPHLRRPAELTFEQRLAAYNRQQAEERLRNAPS